MPCRRSHKKSRNGCAECKKRHVKCDEQVPECTFCNSRQFKCQYTRLPSRGQIQEMHLQDPSRQNWRELSTARDTGVLQLDTRLLEANLLHHYYTDTSMIQSDTNDPSYQFWHFIVPKIATRESFALDSILAFTALHMAYSESNQRNFWITTALSYNDKACSKLSKMVGRMSAATFESALVCSIFITLFVIARHQFSAPSSYLCEVMSIKGLIQGCTIFDNKAKLFEPRNASSANKSRESGSSEKISLNVNREQHADSRLHYLGSRILAQLKDTNTGSSSPNHHIYLATIQSLLDMFDNKNNRESGRSIYLWPHFFQDAFTELLQARDFISRLIFLLYPWRLHAFKDSWYIGDFGEKLSDELFPLREPVPQEWLEIFRCIKGDFKDQVDSCCTI